MADPKTPSVPAVRRGFIEVAEGQVHYRFAGDGQPGIPLVMFHASPGSSAMLGALISRFARTRRTIAPDTLGNGDSPPPAHRTRDILPYAQAHVRALDGLGIDRFDVYGSHTGGCIASEIAIRWPGRVRRMILDGMSVYADDEREDMLATYAPGVTLDQNGAHVQWIWNFVRDTYLYWPWYRRDKAHLRDVGLPAADVIHDKAVEVMKAARTYHLPYQAAIAYPKSERLPLVAVPTLLACAETDMLKVYFDKAASLLPHAETALTPGLGTDASADRTVAIMTAFLDRA